jgi:hypothetical protein
MPHRFPIVCMYVRREGDPTKGWSTVLITAPESWEKPVSRGQYLRTLRYCTLTLQLFILHTHVRFCTVVVYCPLLCLLLLYPVGRTDVGSTFPRLQLSLQLSPQLSPQCLSVTARSVSVPAVKVMVIQDIYLHRYLSLSSRIKWREPAL